MPRLKGLPTTLPASRWERGGKVKREQVKERDKSSSRSQPHRRVISFPFMRESGPGCVKP